MSTRIKLPEGWPLAVLPLEELFWRRRSVRHFGRRPLTLQQAAQLLWAAAGVSDKAGFRTAPSAGALYPLEVFLVGGCHWGRWASPGRTRRCSPTTRSARSTPARHVWCCETPRLSPIL